SRMRQRRGATLAVCHHSGALVGARRTRWTQLHLASLQISETVEVLHRNQDNLPCLTLVLGAAGELLFVVINGLALHRDLFDLSHFAKANAYDILCNALWKGEIKSVNAIIFFVAPV